MDSTHSKDSNDILFVIFGPIDQKIWILQDSIEIWFEILFWICFESEADTWRNIIGQYQFVWITVLGR
jgi:hypothetical protein